MFGDVTLRCEDITSLRALTRLRELRINGLDEDSNTIAEVPTFGTQHLVRLLRGLSCLRRIGIWLLWVLFDDGSLLRRIGEAAQALEELELNVKCNTPALDPSAATPLFPGLKELWISGFELVMPPGIDEADAVFSIEHLL